MVKETLREIEYRLKNKTKLNKTKQKNKQNKTKQKKRLSLTLQIQGNSKPSKFGKMILRS